MRLNEYPYRKRFSATIVEPVLVVGEPYYDGMYLLKLDAYVAKKLLLDHILFLPQWYDFRRGLINRGGRVPKGPYRVSLERFLFSSNAAIRSGRQSLHHLASKGIDRNDELPGTP